MKEEDLMKYFMEQTNVRLMGIERKLEQLIGFRAMLLGITAAVSCLVSIGIELVKRGHI